MIRHAFVFLGTFVAGALIALVARAAWFNPHAGHTGAPPAGGGEYAAMVTNPIAPSQAAGLGTTSAPVATPVADSHANHAAKNPAAAAKAPAADPHAGHADRPKKDQPAPPANAKQAQKTVNTVCPICGMDVDPKLQPAEYKGKLVGFGCAACPPKFKRNPDKWGPSALRNEVLED